ncbi:hypothetical protein SKAU_G00425400 [Synaphobranchus kaupii]|uniref:Uncharacterized protein n=1 Tax=Synaphobranchus kaupii TaxID=118154 RepID=A0A9Q1E5Q7_SYNKA|nr:hypothetical protein SKAU_G00425400 [Synaphobranchus kaupii]
MHSEFALIRSLAHLPRYIIIHTGTNDLRSEQERVGGLVCRVAERATEAFPNSKIILSTLLPRKDFHPATIQRVNADITRGCALLPNVHLAHHSTISPHDLYDHVHLNKHAGSTDDVQLASPDERVIKSLLSPTDSFLEWSGLEVKGSKCAV